MNLLGEHRAAECSDGDTRGGPSTVPASVREAGSPRVSATTRSVAAPAQPAPAHPVWHAAWELWLTRLLTAGTLLACVMVTRELVEILLARSGDGDVWGSVSQIAFMTIVAALLYGGFVYMITRSAFLRRKAAWRPVEHEELEALFVGEAPALAVLVPSYKEETATVRRTLLSAALQDYPNRRVVLLIDDPPNSANPKERQDLEAARALPDEVRTLLEPQARHFAAARSAFRKRAADQGVDPAREGRTLAALYRQAGRWFQLQAVAYPCSDHADAFFIDRNLRASATAHAQRARELRQLGGAGALSPARIEREYNRLAALFAVELTSFERKRFVNCSHLANKAMNLNSYIALLGRSYRERSTPQGRLLEAADAAGATLHVPDAEFLITLDADSVLSPDYALRLVHQMRRPGNEQVAVAQTPYSAFPHAPGELERIAGATTDVQYQIHQGFTAYRATFWVGANALLRRRALDDIRTMTMERGYPVARYIQDHTVIEDTESSVDLAACGWGLFNYPDRLAYSATPPDFGSLLIQRRRWANGGLLILPKCLRYLARGPGRLAKVAEGFFRVHYLVSITTVNVGLLILLAFPFEQSMRSYWLPLSAAPYFYLYGRDLARIGYRFSDVLRVYALNLLLIPVNLGGVGKSLEQAVTGRQSAFGRTPKVPGRTATPAFYLLAVYGLLALWLFGCGVDLLHGRGVHAAFAAGNSAFLGYAIVRYIGLRETWADLRLAFGIPPAGPAVGLAAQPGLQGAFFTKVHSRRARHRTALAVRRRRLATPPPSNR